MVFKETKFKNIKITDAKLCGECCTIQTSNFIHMTSAIYSSYDRGDEGMAEAFCLWRYKMLEFISAFRHHTSDIARMNADMVVELLRPQLEVTTKDIESEIIMGLYHHRDLIGSREAFIKGKLNFET